MIVNNDENTITFNKNQIFRTKLWNIRNNVVKNEFQVNNEVIMYASIQEIEFGENNITLSLLGKDETEFNYSISKEYEENEIPNHLNVELTASNKIDTYLKLFVLESYNAFISGETEAPVSPDVNELLEQIEELTNSLNEANEQLANSVQEKQKIFPITINDTEYSLEIIEMNHNLVYFKIYNDDGVFSPNNFGQQRGAHLWVDNADNSLTITPYFDEVPFTNGIISNGVSEHAGQLYTPYPNDDFYARNFNNPVKFGLEIKVTDSNNEVLSNDEIEYIFEVDTDLITTPVWFKRRLPIYWYGGTTSHGWTLNSDYPQGSSHKPTIAENTKGDAAFLVFDSNDQIISTIPAINNTISLDDITGWAYIKLIDEYGESVIFNKP